MLCYNNRLTFPIYISNQKFENSMDLLLVTDGDNRIMCTSNILKDLFLTKQKLKTKNTFVRVACSVLVVKKCRQKMQKFVWVLMVQNQ